MINEADINQRMIELVQMETGLTNELNNLQKMTTQKQADLFAVQGAKQDCAFWLGKLTPQVKSEPAPITPPPAIPPAVLNSVKNVGQNAAGKAAAKPDQAKAAAAAKKVTNTK